MTLALVRYQRCLILGSGGHASVLIECLRAGDKIRPCWITDPIEKGIILNVPIAGDDSVIPDLIKEGKVDCFAIGVDSTTLRDALFRKMYCREGIDIVSAIHPTSFVSPSVTIGAGCQLMARSVIQSNTVLGYNVLVNTGAIVEHDCVISSHSHIAPGAILLGGVRVGQGTLVGAGAVINPGVHVGCGCVIGSGAVVTKDVEALTTVCEFLRGSYSNEKTMSGM